MKKKFCSHVGKICIAKYKDASYSYIDVMKEKIYPPNPIISVGKLRRVTDTLIDLSTIWFEKENKYVDGIVIPIKAVISVEEIKFL